MAKQMKIAFMGQTFTANEMRIIRKIWRNERAGLSEQYPRTYKKFSQIMDMAVKMAESVERGDRDYNDKGGG